MQAEASFLFEIENTARVPHSCGMCRLLLVLLLISGCDKPQSNSAVKSTNEAALHANTPPHLDHAQPKLRTMKLWLGPKEITSEIAITDVERSTGMMFRDKMEENEGMLFIFGLPDQRSDDSYGPKSTPIERRLTAVSRWTPGQQACET